MCCLIITRAFSKKLGEADNSRLSNGSGVKQPDETPHGTASDQSESRR